MYILNNEIVKVCVFVYFLFVSFYETNVFVMESIKIKNKTKQSLPNKTKNNNKQTIKGTPPPQNKISNTSKKENSL